MKFMSIESALRKLVGETQPGGKYYQTAGVFERVLKHPKMSAEDKAEAIAALISDGNSADLSLPPER